MITRQFFQREHALAGTAACLQGQSLIRVLRIAPADSSAPQSWTGYSTSLQTATESLAMATVALSKEVLQRPQARSAQASGIHGQKAGYGDMTFVRPGCPATGSMEVMLLL